MYTFKKEERLCNKRLLEQLFNKGSSFLCYPYRVSWLIADEPLPAVVQVVFPVAKKRYKLAVHRNQIRRHMREAYRLNKQSYLYNPLLAADKKLLLSISYIGKQIERYELMELKMLKLFKQLCEQMSNDGSN